MRPAAFAFILLACLDARAQEALSLRDLMHARDYAMGNAYRAHGLGAEATYGNPAAIALHKRYQLELSGAWDVHNKFAFGTASIADSHTTDFAAGMSYHYVSLGRGATRRTVHLTTLALSVPVSDMVFLGASGRYVIAPGPLANGFTMDSAVLVRPIPFLAFSLSAHNLIDIGNPDVQRFYALSVAVLTGAFTAAIEGRGDFTDQLYAPKNLGGGLEYFAAGAFPLRVGYGIDLNQLSHFVAGGVGYFHESGVGIDAAYRHEINGARGQLVALTFKMQVH